MDLGLVRRSRRRGLLGLGQPMKSFRDSEVLFPQYQPGQAASPSLRQLGELIVPGQASTDAEVG
jgi:hypothetical protein